MRAKNNKKTVAIALSGGVDSSVAAALLKKQGYKATGVHIKIWSDPEIPCTLRDERYDAMRVATKLNIPFQTWDFTKAYKKAVVDYMIDEYKNYHTPNPDVICNRDIKFGMFLKKAKELGFDYIATGHYARITRITINYKPYTINYRLLKGRDKNKDQSYFLWALTQDQLRHVLFPIGKYRKVHVRKLARKFNLPTAEKKDSQGICFIGEIDLRAFLKKYIPKTPGKIITTDGEVIGEHDGLYYYTIGQRHGIGIGGGTPYYVAAKDVRTNTLVVSKGSDEPVLFSKELVAIDLNWISGRVPNFPLQCKARIRYRQPLESCHVESDKTFQDHIHVVFNRPQKAVASGQSIVFYKKEEVLGGGIIE